MARIIPDYPTFKTEVLESTQPVLVDFFATWCGPCKMLAPVIDQLAQEQEGKVKVVKVDVDEVEAAAMDYGVMSIPTLILFKDGEPVDQKVGVVSKAVLEAMIAE